MFESQAIAAPRDFEEERPLNGELPSRLNDLLDNARKTHAMLRDLQKRLSPVLSPSPADPNKAADEPRPPTSPLTGFVVDVNGVLRECQQTIREIMTNLDL